MTVEIFEIAECIKFCVMISVDFVGFENLIQIWLYFPIKFLPLKKRENGCSISTFFFITTPALF